MSTEIIIDFDFFKNFDKSFMKKMSMQIFYLDAQTELDSVADLEFIGNLFKCLNRDKELCQYLDTQQESKDYMVNDFSYQTVNNLLQNKGYENAIVQYHHDCIIKQVLIFLISLDKITKKASDTINKILDCKNNLYYKYNYNFDGNYELIFGRQLQFNDSHNNIKQNDKIMVFDINNKIWRQSQVVEVKDEMLIVIIDNDKKKEVNKRSWLIQPYNIEMVCQNLDDSIPHIESNLKKPSERLFSVIRQDNNNFRIIYYLNLIGKRGFLNRMIQMVKEYIHIDIVINMCDILQTYCKNIVNGQLNVLIDLIQGLYGYLEVEDESIQKTLSYQKVYKVIGWIDTLEVRVGDEERLVKQFELKSMLIRRCIGGLNKSLERELKGIKLLESLVIGGQYEEKVKTLMEQVQMGQLLDMNMSHLQVIMKSDKIFIYMLNQEMVEMDRLKTFLCQVWNGSDKECKQLYCQLLGENMKQLAYKQQMSVLTSMQGLQLEDAQLKVISMVGGQALSYALEILWKGVLNDHDLHLFYFKQLISIDEEQRSKYVAMCKEIKSIRAIQVINQIAREEDNSIQQSIMSIMMEQYMQMNEDYLLWLTQLAEALRKQLRIEYSQLQMICNALVEKRLYKDLLWFMNQLVVVGHQKYVIQLYGQLDRESMEEAFQKLKQELNKKGLIRFYKEVIVYLDMNGIQDYSIEILRSIFQMTNHVEGNLVFKQDGYELKEGQQLLGLNQMYRLSLECQVETSRQLQQFLGQIYRNQREELVRLVVDQGLVDRQVQFINVIINEEEAEGLNQQRDHYYDHVQIFKTSMNIKFSTKGIENFGLDMNDNQSLMEIKQKISEKTNVHVQFIRVTLRNSMLPNYKNSWSLRQLDIKQFEQIQVNFNVNEYYIKRLTNNLNLLPEPQLKELFGNLYNQIEKKDSNGLNVNEFVSFFINVSKRLQSNNNNSASLPQNSQDKQEKQIQSLFAKICKNGQLNQSNFIDYLVKMNKSDQQKIVNILMNSNYNVELSQKIKKIQPEVRKLLSDDLKFHEKLFDFIQNKQNKSQECFILLNRLDLNKEVLQQIYQNSLDLQQLKQLQQKVYILKVIQNLMVSKEEKDKKWQLEFAQKTGKELIKMLQETQINEENREIHGLIITILYYLLLKVEEDVDDIQVYLLDKQLGTKQIHDTYIHLNSHPEILSSGQKQSTLSDKRVQYLINKVIEERSKRGESIFLRADLAFIREVMPNIIEFVMALIDDSSQNELNKYQIQLFDFSFHLLYVLQQYSHIDNAALKQLLTKALFSQRLSIRKKICNLFILMNFNHIKQQDYQFQQMLQEFLYAHLNQQKDSLINNEEFINQYFEFFGLVLQLSEKQQYSNDTLFFQVLDITLEKLEKKQTQLVCYFNFMKILSKSTICDQAFIDRIFSKFLYNEQKSLIQSDKERVLIQDILLNLCKNNDLDDYLINSLICQQIDKFEQIVNRIGDIGQLKEIQKESMEVSSKSEQVGLKNLGCTCYINSVLQQLFNIPLFRNRLLSHPIGLTSSQDIVQTQNDYHKNYNNRTILDNLSYQLQQVFLHLQMSSKQVYNPVDFCFAFKDYMGCPVNTAVQSDAHEFVNILFDKLESVLPQECLEMFQGFLQISYKCTSCNYIRNKKEKFYCLQLEIKNNQDIYQSLASYFRQEEIHDYLCDQCNTKQIITKDITIYSQPKILLLQLQRIIFDMDTLQNKKINTRFELFNDIGMDKYVDGFQGDSQENNKFNLKGVVVHNGTADYGHYYSYIKRDGQGDWLEYNDATVKKFDFNTDFQKETFGGYLNNNTFYTSFEGDQGNSSESKLNRNSAYLVLYENNEYQKENKGDEKEIDQSLLDSIEQENKQHIIYQQIFDNNLLYLVTIVVKNYVELQEKKQESMLNIMKIVFITVFRLINQTNPANAWCIKELTNYINVIFAQIEDKQQILKYLQEYNLYTYLIENSEQSIRQFTQQCILICFQIDNKTSFINNLISDDSLIACSKNFQKHAEYFQLFIQLIEIDNDLIMVLMNTDNFVNKLFEYLMQNNIKTNYIKKKLSQIGGKYIVSNFDDLINLFVLIIKYLYKNKIIDQYEEVRQVIQDDYQIYEHLLKQQFNCTLSIVDWFKLMARDDLKRSLQQIGVIQWFLRNKLIINSQNNNESVQHSNIIMVLQLIHEILMIDDEYQQMRIQLLMGLPNEITQDIIQIVIDKKHIYEYENIVMLNKSYSQSQSSFIPLLFLPYYSSIKAKFTTHLFNMCKLNPKIKEYLMNMPAPSLEYSNMYIHLMALIVIENSSYYMQYEDELLKEAIPIFKNNNTQSSIYLLNNQTQLINNTTLYDQSGILVQSNTIINYSLRLKQQLIKILQDNHQKINYQQSKELSSFIDKQILSRIEGEQKQQMDEYTSKQLERRQSIGIDEDEMMDMIAIGDDEGDEGEAQQDQQQDQTERNQLIEEIQSEYRKSLEVVAMDDTLFNQEQSHSIVVKNKSGKSLNFVLEMKTDTHLYYKAISINHEQTLPLMTLPQQLKSIYIHYIQ